LRAKSKIKEVMAMLKAKHSHEDSEVVEKKSTDVEVKLSSMKKLKAAKCVEGVCQRDAQLHGLPT
jgi:hypothetical protein